MCYTIPILSLRGFSPLSYAVKNYFQPQISKVLY